MRVGAATEPPCCVVQRYIFCDKFAERFRNLIGTMGREDSY